MVKNTIVQFVGFATNLDADRFISDWDGYAKKEMHKKYEPVLLQQLPQTKHKFRFISQHEWPDTDVRLSFKNQKRSAYFPDQSVQIIQIGGYMPVQFKKGNPDKDGDTRVLAFVGHNENDLDFYRQLPNHNRLNIYQAYYESCAYGYVMEFFLKEKDITPLLVSLKQRSGVETAVYSECLVEH